MAKRQNYRIADLSGGWNPDQSDTLIADNEASDILNYRLDDLGSIVTRSGFSSYLTDDAPATIQGIGRWEDPESEQTSKVLAVAGGTLYHVDDSTDSWTSLYTGLDASADANFVNAEGKVVITNGVDTPIIFDGTDTRTVGIATPVDPTFDSYIAGTIDETVEYVYTYYNSTKFIESAQSELIEAIPSTQGVRIGITASTNPQVDAIRIYRRDVGSSSLNYLFVAQVANTTGTFDDAGIATTAIVPSNTGRQAPALELAAYHAGYMFGSIGNVLYWSDPLQVEDWPPLNVTTVPFVRNDRITNLTAYQDSLVIFGIDNTAIVAGSGGNWTIRRMDVDLGAVNANSALEVNSGLIFLSRQGLRIFPSFEPFTPKLDRLLMRESYDSFLNASVFYIPEERNFGVSIGGVTYIAHVINRALSKYSLVGNSWLVGGEDSFDLPLFVSGDRLLQYGGTTDDGVAISATWKSKVYQFTPELVKHFRRAGVYATIGAGVNFTISVPTTGQSFSVVLDNQSASSSIEWDEFNWDEGNWALEGLQYTIIDIPTDRIFGHTIQVTLTSTTDTTVQIVPPISLEYRDSSRFI